MKSLWDNTAAQRKTNKNKTHSKNYTCKKPQAILLHRAIFKVELDGWILSAVKIRIV